MFTFATMVFTNKNYFNFVQDQQESKCFEKKLNYFVVNNIFVSKMYLSYRSNINPSLLKINNYFSSI